MGKSYHLKEQKISYKKNAFLEDHGGGEDIPVLGAGLNICWSNNCICACYEDVLIFE